MENQKPKGNAMEKLAALIVDKRNLFFLLYIFALIFCAVSTGWVKVENDITTYLPDSTETRQGLTVMNDNFITYGSARVMVSNISYDTALDLQEVIEDIDGVDTVEFDATRITTPMRRRFTRSALTPRRTTTAPRPPCRTSAMRWQSTTPTLTRRWAWIPPLICRRR